MIPKKKQLTAQKITSHPPKKGSQNEVMTFDTVDI